MRRLGYLLKETLANIRINRTTTLIAVGTTGFTLACFGVFLLLYLNLRGLVGSLQGEIEVVLYMNDNLSAREVAQLQQRLEGEPEVASVSLITKEQALQDFREQFPSEHYLLEGLGANPLPASFVVLMAPQFRAPEAVKRWSERQKNLPGVDQVQYSRDWVENLEAIVGYFELIAMAIGSLLAAASVAIIASTIRLTLFARRDDIEIMSMIGATSTFIKIPYLMEGATLGAIGGILAVGILKGGFELFVSHLGASGRLLGSGAAFSFLPVQVSALLVFAGLLLGSTGSFVSLLAGGRSGA